MEVHGINSYGKAPIISNGTEIFLKFPIDKSTSTNAVLRKEKICNSSPPKGQF